ncbi:MAG: hypothetical protein WBE61_09080, partial [Nitrososphaeraceae archaeon]
VNTSISPFGHRRITMKILYMLVVSFQHDCNYELYCLTSSTRLSFHLVVEILWQDATSIAVALLVLFMISLVIISGI